MRSLRFFATCFLLSLAFVVTLNASVIPVDLDVDFREWNVPSGSASHTVDGVTATAKPNGAVLAQDAVDGLGITYGILGDPDEIDHQEKLWVEFDTTTAVAGAWITNLFAFPDAFLSRDGEKGIVSLYDDEDDFLASFIFKGKDAHQDNGEIFVNFGSAGLDGVKKLKFERYDRLFGNEFSVAGLDLGTRPDEGQVPEPSTAVLCLGGLAAAIALRRRQAR